MKLVPTLFALCALAPALGLSQVPARKVIDFSCIRAMAATPCGMTTPMTILGLSIPAGQRILDLANGQETSPLSGNSSVEVSTSCIAYVLANPPAACVAEMYTSVDVNKLLAEQEARARNRERGMCLAIARDASQCPAAIVK